MISKIFNYLKRINNNLTKPGVAIFPNGHFYSPYPDLDDIRKRESELFENIPESLPTIDLNIDAQVALFREFVKFYKAIPFPETKTAGIRYYFENSNYSYGDAIFLSCMIRHLKPKRIIEIGSGFSSCVTLDTNEIFFDNAISCTFIEPYTELLLSLINENDKKRVRIFTDRLQDVDPSIFSELSEGDILFIDSTHVSKAGSDVNLIIFNILPKLRSGVYIHFHDVFYPFEYPKSWIYGGRAWNEDYILRAFLQYNEAFKIVFFPGYLWHVKEEMIRTEMPSCARNIGGALWLKKVKD